MLFRQATPLCKDIRTAGTAVVIEGVASGEWVAVGKERHVAFRPGQINLQRSVAAGCDGATGERAKEPLALCLFNDRLFSPATVKEEVKKKKKTLNIKVERLNLSEAEAVLSLACLD